MPLFSFVRIYRICLSLTILLCVNAPTSAEIVEVTDTGLNMVRETMDIPSGWTLHADIASSPVNGQYTRFQHDVVGPNGEMLRELPPLFYGITTGKSFEQTWQIIAHQGVADFMTVKDVESLMQNGPMGMGMLKELSTSKEQLASTGKRLFEVVINRWSIRL